jgi:hypothetical protein
MVDMEAPALKFWLMVALVLVLTQPEAMAFSHLEEPYTVYKDLSIWIACAGSGLLIVSIYGLYLLHRGKLHLVHPIAVLLFAMGAFWLGYWTKGLGGTGYGTEGMANFIVGGFTVLFVTPPLLLTGLPHSLYRFYDRPLVIVWLFILTITLVLTVLYMRVRAKAYGSW